METIDRFRGALLGMACGDTVGTTVEFKPRGTFPLVTDMVGGGPFKLKPGEWRLTKPIYHFTLLLSYVSIVRDYVGRTHKTQHSYSY